MMKNKGQVVIAFVLVIPIILMVFTIVVDNGLINIEKRKINNTVKDAISYGLDNLDNPEIDKKIAFIINENIKDIENIKIKTDKGIIKVTIVKQIKAIFGSVVDHHKYNIDVTYIGYIENGQKNISKE